MAPRLLGLALAMAIAGWGAFTLYERNLAAGTAAPTTPSEAGPGDEHLRAGRLDEAAAAYQQQVDAGDPAGHVGLAWVEVARAQRAWQAAALAPDDRKALEAFDAQVDAARLQIAAARREARTETAALTPAEQHLNALLVIALGQNGQKERATGALHARLEGTPGAPAMAAWLSATPVPSSSAAPEGDDPPERKPESDKPAPPPSGQQPPPPRRDFEFDREPVVPIPTPGELQLPGGEGSH